MANDFYSIYKKNSLIFVTTHSPAFIDIGYMNEGRGYRCYKEDNVTEVVDFYNADKLTALEEELGYAYILKKQFDEYKEMTIRNEEMQLTVENLQAELKISQKPVLLTEGKTDAKILNIAWEKLYGIECPFDIKSCNLLEEDSNDNAVAGASVLKKILCSTRFDSNKVVIGLFDNDKAGLEEFKLDANYLYADNKLWKVHNNKKGYAFIIPTNE